MPLAISGYRTVFLSSLLRSTRKLGKNDRAEDQHASDQAIAIHRGIHPKLLRNGKQVPEQGSHHAEDRLCGHQNSRSGWVVGELLPHDLPREADGRGEHTAKQDRPASVPKRFHRGFAEEQCHDQIEQTANDKFQTSKGDGAEILGKFSHNNDLHCPEDGATELVIGYSLNETSIIEYEKATGKSLNYGVFVAIQSQIGNEEIFDDKGNAKTGTIAAPIESHKYVTFEFKLTGFTEESYDVKLAMGVYTALTDGESAEYSYIQNKEPNEGDIYYFTSFKEAVNA